MMTLRLSSCAGALARIAMIVAAAGLLAACSSKKPNSGNQFGLANGADGVDGAGSDYSRGRYSGGGPVKPGTERDFTVNVGDKVYFKTDSVQLTSESQETLRQQAQWLNQYPNHTITVEGHSDERGTREYNLGLAAKRAQVVKKYLSGLGVNGARMRTISYGKERPVSMCNDISCWSQNRRGVTLLNKNS